MFVICGADPRSTLGLETSDVLKKHRLRHADMRRRGGSGDMGSRLQYQDHWCATMSKVSHV